MFKRIMESIIGHIEALFLIMFLKMIADWNDLGPAKGIMTWLMNGGINAILFYRLLEAIQCAEDIGIKMPWSRWRKKNDDA